MIKEQGLVMPKIEYLYNLAGINPCQLSKDEILLLEAVLLNSVCNELSSQYQLNSNHRENNQEKTSMKNDHFILLIIQDLINSNDYTISGIASYSNTPEEVIIDIILGHNTNPSIEVSRKIIELHRIARPNLYKQILNKITQHLFSTSYNNSTFSTS